MIDNGFTPEWITLQKEIRNETNELRSNLLKERENFGPSPLDDNTQSDWCQVVQKYSKAVEKINTKINKFNLIVPMMNKQMLLVNLLKEAQNVLKNGKYCVDGMRKVERKQTLIVKNSVLDSLFSIFDAMLKK